MFDSKEGVFGISRHRKTSLKYLESIKIMKKDMEVLKLDVLLEVI